MHASRPPESTGWRRLLTTRVIRGLAALGVVAAAAVIVPTLTSQPSKDKDAVQTADRDRSSTTVDLEGNTDDVALELPSELTTVPATDVTKATTKTTASSRATTTTKATATTAGSSTTQATAPSSTTPPTSSTTQPSGSCALARDTGAENEIASLYEARTSGMRRTASMDAAARSWACVMAGRQVAAHKDDFGPGSQRAPEIFSACGGCRSIAENVAFNSTANAAWQAWLVSPAHQPNIDAPGPGTYGIAAYKNGNSIYFVHVFGHS